ncbi:MAG: HAD hydrolase-like protein [archaeon]
MDYLSKKRDLYLVTNSSEEFFSKAIKKIRSARKLKRMITASDGFTSKGDAIKSVLKELNMEPKGIFYVGDTIYDIETAHKAGCKCAVIYWKHSWDYGRLDEIKKMKPEAVARSLDDLKGVLLNE